MVDRPTSFAGRLRRVLLGGARSPTDPHVFRKVSLVALLAWIGLGSDGISSSCYGPAEAFRALVTPQGDFTSLAVFLAIMTAVTVFVITASYMQIIELFPSGGGAYLVASKLINPTVGMVAGSALVVDYVLTITVSVAAGALAIFSFLPAEWADARMPVAFAVLIALTVLNLRGVKESVIPIVPVFALFMLTHVFVIFYAIFSHSGDFPALYSQTTTGVRQSVETLGVWGALFVLLHAYSMGGGTYTGIEAVSNSMGILHEPRVATGKRTMLYMAISLAFIAGGLIVAYLLFGVRAGEDEHRTLNAILFDELAADWGKAGNAFVTVTLISEALILLVAAQTGFLGGPAVLANMATDGWMPRQFSMLSDRLVTQNGILMMGVAALGLLWLTGGDVRLLVILYAINVFLTFTLSQIGMVRHWWSQRGTAGKWRRGLAINGVGLLLTGLILVTVVLVKFAEGGWITLIVTTAIVGVALLIRRHYNETSKMLRRLDVLFTSNLPVKTAKGVAGPEGEPPSDANTAVLLVSGFNGLGLHTLFNVLRVFRKHFTNFVFIQVGVVDAGRFKGVQEIDHLKASAAADVKRYVDYMRAHGFYAEGVYSVGTDVVEEVTTLARQVVGRYPHSVVFTGQLIFPGDTIATRLLHNYMSFAIQRQLYYEGVPVLVMPIRM
jgi:amino acid transporter